MRLIQRFHHVFSIPGCEVCFVSTRRNYSPNQLMRKVISILSILACHTFSEAQTINFFPAANTAVPALPYGIVSSDFNNDGHADLAVPSQGSNSVSILLGNGSGGFGAPTSFNAGTLPLNLAVGDFNGDTHRDIVVSNMGASNITLLPGNGSGGFGLPVDFASGFNTWGIAVGDFNEDGNQDVVTSSTTSGVAILLGNGLGSFGLPSGYTTPGGPSFIAVDDVNGDNHQDFAVTNQAGNNVSVFIGSGTGTFTTATNYPVQTNPIGIVIADFNGDTNKDIAVANMLSKSISILPGDGLGNFGSASNFSAGGEAVGVLATDFNQDGLPDLAVTNRDVSSVTVLTGAGSGSFNAPKSFTVATGPRGITASDFNGDGNPDLASAGYTSGNISVLLFNPASPAPTISSFTPSSGNFGTTVTIFGTNFDLVAANNAIQFNGANAGIPLNVTATSLTVEVPSGASSGPISVTTSAGTAISPLPFIIDATYTPFGNTVNLTGVPDHIEVIDHPALRPFSLTVEAWIKASTLQDFGLVASKPVGNFTQNSYALWFEGGKLAGGVNPIGLATAITYDWVPVINQWYHVAFTYDDNTHVQVLYLNGAVVATGSGSTPDYDGQPFLIGADINFGTLGAHFPGFIDELRLWNVARTQSEIQATLNVTLLGNEPGLTAYYKMDEVGRGAGITVTNSAITTAPQLDGLTYGTTCNPIFTLNAVSIISFNPVTGMAGTSVTLDGNNFDATPVNNTVTFNGTAATVTAATTTSLTVMVPVGAVTGPITVTTSCGTQSTSNTNFNVICTPPATPTGNNAGRCGPGSVTLSASGGTAGQYRWYPLAVGGSADATQQSASFNTPAISSTTSFWVAINDGTCESARTEVIATVLPLPTAPGIQPINAICPGSDITLTATGGTDGQYRWYDGATIISGAVNSTLAVANLTSAKTFSASIHDGTCESNKTSVVASIKNCTAPSVESTVATAFVNGIVAINLENLISDPEGDLDPASLQIIEQPQSGAAATLEGFNLNIDYSGIAFSGTDRVTVGICDLTNLCTEQAVTIELGGQIKIYNAVSPNGDGKNEIFFIQYIELLPETQRNTVSIYNRWGDEVFQTKNYNNTSNVFKGESNTGDKLPSGTYFYKIIFASGKSRTGFLELKR